jgi:hypothetical protein
MALVHRADISANATLLANLAPIFVDACGVDHLAHSADDVMFSAGLAIALAGVMMLIGGDLN